MTQIDTKAKRELANYFSAHDNPEAGNALWLMCDELDRLYLDTAPLSRADLETVLRGAGLKLEAQTFGSASYRTFDQSGEVLVYILHNGLITIEKKEIVLRNIPLSAVTRRLLKDCGVIA